MNAVPTRNPEISVERDEGGVVTLAIPLRQGNWGKMLNRLLKKPIEAHRHVILDEIGSYVWNRCDGQRTVRQVVNGVVERFKLNWREGERATLSFLQQLGKRRYMVFVIYPEKSSNPGGQ